MVNVIYAAHRKGGREYIWRIPENMQVNVQDWAVVRTQYGICIVQVQRLGEVDDAEAEKLESVLQAVSDRAMLPVPDPKKKSSSAETQEKSGQSSRKGEKALGGVRHGHYPVLEQGLHDTAARRDPQRAADRYRCFPVRRPVAPAGQDEEKTLGDDPPAGKIHGIHAGWTEQGTGKGNSARH